MDPLVIFGWGVAGSVAVEIVSLLGHYYAEPVRLPERYRRPGFWLTRVSLALLAGLLALGYDIEQKILAFNIGAATPLIITSLARGIRPATVSRASLTPPRSASPVQPRRDPTERESRRPGGSRG